MVKIGSIKPKHWILIAVFAIVLSIRIYLAFQTQQFSSDEAYYTLRQVEHIRQTGLPIIHDNLSYSGRTLFVLPGFYYVLAFFNLFLPLIFVAKIIPNIMACTLIFLAYLIARKITNHETTSVIIACLSGFMPLYFSDTINTISAYSFVIPLTFLFVYLFMDIEEKHNLIYVICTFFMLLLSHAILAIIILGMGLYLLFLKIEGIERKKIELESVLFFFFVSLWFYILAYKRVFLFQGPEFIWQNIPTHLFSNYFSGISLFTIFNQIGIIPFLFGIYIIYRYLFREKNRNLYFLIILCIECIVLITLRLITLNLGIMLLSIILLLLFSQSIKLYNLFMEKSKFEKHSKLLSCIFVIVIFITLLPPSIAYASNSVQNAFTQNEIDALTWLRQNSNKDAIIAAFPDEGNLISEVAGRKNIMDSNFIQIPNIDERYEDLNRIYTTGSVVEAMNLLNKYHATYIFVPKDKLSNQYGITDIKYFDDKCFIPAYDVNNVTIYQLTCEVKTE